MGVAVSVPEQLHARLQHSARKRGCAEVAELLEHWQTREEQSDDSEVILREVDAIHNELAASGRVFSDSVDLIREDRERLEAWADW